VNMEEIKLPCYGIVVHTDGEGAGSITSDLHDTLESNPELAETLDEYNAAIDGLESLILAHACAGIDITSPAYLEGIETAEAAIGNNFS